MPRRKRDDWRSLRTCLRCGAFFHGEPGRQYCEGCKRIGQQIDRDHKRFLEAWRNSGGKVPKNGE